ncbi:MAG: PilZ domain-containing protein [Thermodesulfovibrionales bacterium]
MSKRWNARFIRRLETEFWTEEKNYRAISSDFSCNGLFIRTNHAFEPGTVLSIRVHLPDGQTSELKGRVRRALKTTVVSLKNGMGIELLEKDLPYTNFMLGFTGECDKKTGEPEPKLRPVDIPPVTEKTADIPAPDIMTIGCPACGVKNKVKTAQVSHGPKCGKCGSLLSAT